MVELSILSVFRCSNCLLLPVTVRRFDICCNFSQVTIHLMIFGVSACVFSTLSGKLSKCIPSIAFIVFASIVDASTYAYYLYWTPNGSTQWSVIPAYILAGGMQGIWKPQSIGESIRFYKILGKLFLGKISTISKNWFRFTISDFSGIQLSLYLRSRIPSLMSNC